MDQWYVFIITEVRVAQGHVKRRSRLPIVEQTSPSRSLRHRPICGRGQLPNPYPENPNKESQDQVWRDAGLPPAQDASRILHRLEAW